MPIHFACPACKTTYTVNDRDVGKKSECKTCGQRVQVPAPVRAPTVLGEIVPPPAAATDRPKLVHWTEAPPPPPTAEPTRPAPEPAAAPAATPAPSPEPPPRPKRRDRYADSRVDRSPVYNNEESARFRSDLSGDELERVIEDVVGRIGYVSFFRGGEFEVAPGRFQSFATDVKMAGYLSRGRRDDEWTVSISFSVQPSAVCWVIAILGILFFLVGLLILIIPFTAKNSIQQAVGRAVRDVRDHAERGRD